VNTNPPIVQVLTKSICIKLVFTIIGLLSLSTPLKSSTLAVDPKASLRNAHTSIGWHKSQIEVKGVIREYRYFLPTNFHENSPVVFLLHGGTQNMTKLFARNAGASKHWPTLAEREGFVLMVPNGGDPKTGEPFGKKLNWNDCRPSKSKSRYISALDDVSFIADLIEWAKNNLLINEDKVFVTGASNGGMMSYRLAMEIPSKITAVAAFIANLPVSSECSPKDVAIPMLIFNSTDDSIMPWAGGEITNNGGHVKSTADTVAYWLRTNGSIRQPAEIQTFTNTNTKDKSHITGVCYPKLRLSESNDFASEKTCFYQVNGGGHVLPSARYRVPKWIQNLLLGQQNRDIESAEVAWDFFLNSER
jgi:polyhydroxybutyrate depolymerase